jgi:hypothetical protein
MSAAQRVDFFIVGVQKGGTTALASYLSRSPAIQFATVKEVHHFDDEVRVDWSAPRHDDLHSQFDWSVSDVVRGEATPIYCYWPSALSRLQRYNPAAKLLVGLRHPTFRAFSHWRMERARNTEDMAFEQAISPQGRKRVSDAPGGVHRVFSYIERGLYAAQFVRMTSLFPRGQIHVFRTDRLWDQPAATLSAIERFLGVDPLLGADVRRRYVTPVEGGRPPAFPVGARHALDDLFADDIRRMAELAGLDLSDWLSPDYREPMAARSD